MPQLQGYGARVSTLMSFGLIRGGRRVQCLKISCNRDEGGEAQCENCPGPRSARGEDCREARPAAQMRFLNARANRRIGGPITVSKKVHEIAGTYFWALVYAFTKASSIPPFCTIHKAHAR